MQLVEARDLDTSPPQWLVDGMIPRIGVGLLHGPSFKAAKSLLTDNELALAVANGTSFLGHACVKGPVVLCLGEGLYDAGVRLKARLARQVRDDDAAVAAVAAQQGSEAAAAFRDALPPYTDDNLSVIPVPFDVPLTRARELSRSARSAIAMIKTLAEAPELVILDSLADFTSLSLSNDASANRIMLGLKEMARELDCCVLAITHDTANERRMLGAQRLFNASDFVIAATPEATTGGATPKVVTLTCEKSKYGRQFEPLSYRVEEHFWLEPELDEDDEPTGELLTVTSASVRLVDDAAHSSPAPVRQDERVTPDLRDARPPQRKRNGLRSSGSRPHLNLVAPRFRLG